MENLQRLILKVGQRLNFLKERQSMRQALMTFALVILAPGTATAQDTQRTLDESLHHLRIAGPREWSEFPEQPEAASLDLKFSAKPNPGEWTLRLRQQDVKQTWNVLLNGKPLGQLVRDENEMITYFAVPKGALALGENHLTIEERETTPDDIRVGEIVLESRPRAAVLSQTILRVEVRDADTGEPLPARITITDARGALQTTGAVSNDHLAVRPGIVYTATGDAKIGLPPGKYKIYAGRGFEYSLAEADVSLKPGGELKQRLTIRREVPTPGYVACDTHIHTLTHSGHGDASVQERMITLAAEGIELPIATDHNVQIDHEPFAREMNVRKYFTPVIGNEVTTPVGHFNIFPVLPGVKPPAYRLKNWNLILNGIYKTPGVKVAILNHARDLHSGVRPFGPKRFNAVVGENLDGWPMQFNAMEVVNSGATQTDPLQLFSDWMTLLNRGYKITPIGSSDSHDVARHFVGQGRTYIRANDEDVSWINADEAVNNLIQGRVMVSYGLLAEIEVDGKYGSGELAPVPKEAVKVGVRVLGPSWVTATRVTLFANGEPIRKAPIPPDSLRDLPAGVCWQGEWTLARPKHDVHLVAIATGPGIDKPYWKTAKPYQPKSPDWDAKVIGCSGAVWLDADRDGRKMSAYDYAKDVFAKSQGDLPTLLELLAEYDGVVAAQAANIYQASGRSLLNPEVQKRVNQADAAVKQGFLKYIAAWRESQIARSSLQAE